MFKKKILGIVSCCTVLGSHYDAIGADPSSADTTLIKAAGCCIIDSLQHKGQTYALRSIRGDRVPFNESLMRHLVFLDSGPETSAITAEKMFCTALVQIFARDDLIVDDSAVDLIYRSAQAGYLSTIEIVAASCEDFFDLGSAADKPRIIELLKRRLSCIQGTKSTNDTATEAIVRLLSETGPIYSMPNSFVFDGSAKGILEPKLNVCSRRIDQGLAAKENLCSLLELIDDTIGNLAGTISNAFFELPDYTVAEIVNHNQYYESVKSWLIQERTKITSDQ